MDRPAVLIRFVSVLLACTALAGCESEAERAEAYYRATLAGNSSHDEICRAAQAAVVAYYAEGKERRAKALELNRDVACNSAELCRSVGGCAPRNLDPSASGSGLRPEPLSTVSATEPIDPELFPDAER